MVTHRLLSSAMHSKTTTMTGLSLPWCCPSLIYAVFICDDYHLLFPICSMTYGSVSLQQTWLKHYNLQHLMVGNRGSWHRRGWGKPKPSVNNCICNIIPFTCSHIILSKSLLLFFWKPLPRWRHASNDAVNKTGCMWARLNDSNVDLVWPDFNATTKTTSHNNKHLTYSSRFHYLNNCCES